MGRPSVRLANGLVRATLEPEGGMVPELGIERESRFLNVHWIPAFREPSGAPWSETLHGAFGSPGSSTRWRGISSAARTSARAAT